MEYEILPGVKIVIDPEKYTVTQAMSMGLSDPSADVKIVLDATIIDVIEGNEAKALGILQLRSK